MGRLQHDARLASRPGAARSRTQNDVCSVRSLTTSACGVTRWSASAPCLSVGPTQRWKGARALHPDPNRLAGSRDLGHGTVSHGGARRRYSPSRPSRTAPVLLSTDSHSAFVPGTTAIAIALVILISYAN